METAGIMPQCCVGSTVLMGVDGKGERTFESAVTDVKDYATYYNYTCPHRYNSGLPPVFTKTTYLGLLN
ncbi:hypothetical protein FHQ28_07295 [Pasteurellaceae bacterium USgator11]|nr:hypothetical protein FHQ24_09785 [Pasteurellaceae bacterium UScroc31]TNG97845.1 hypothetical protein FHQ20_01980 [Pasteurellaceae bacterium USgator41]TNH00705.1 hypothetical protein FHQ28_07295 [Pasteurellaceae bacterium USgator11]